MDLRDGITRTFVAAGLSVIDSVSVNQPMRRVDTQPLTFAGQSWDRRVPSPQSGTYPTALSRDGTYSPRPLVAQTAAC